MYGCMYVSCFCLVIYVCMCACNITCHDVLLLEAITKTLAMVIVMLNKSQIVSLRFLVLIHPSNPHKNKTCVKVSTKVIQVLADITQPTGIINLIHTEPVSIAQGIN